MKISIQQLRKVIQEELAYAHSQAVERTKDNDLDVGKEVNVVSDTGLSTGKITGRYSGDGGEGTVWTVRTDDGKTVQKRAEELKSTEVAEEVPGQVDKHVPDDDKDKNDKLDNLLTDDLNEGDDKAVEDDFKKQHYEFMAQKIVFNWNDRSHEVSWPAVANSFVRAAKSTSGKTLDADKLLDAIEKVLAEKGEGEGACYHDKQSRN